MIALIVFVWLRERITKFECFAMICCFAGIAIVAFNHDEKEPEEETEDGEVKEEKEGD